MKTVQWQMKEDFEFPRTTGTPTGIESVRVTPRFKIDRSEDSVRMTGIYHLAVTVQFDLEVPAPKRLDSATLIDDVELNGELGYFEYAVPFNIDLPPEANDPLNLATANASCETEGQGAISVIWEVQCSYKEMIVVQEDSTRPNQVETQVENAVKKEAAEKAQENEAPKTEEVAEVAENAPATEPAVTYENVSVAYEESDEILAFITGLDDGVSTTLFSSNNVPVQSES